MLEEVIEQYGVMVNPGGNGGNIAVQRENRREGGEEHHIVGDVDEEKNRNGSTNAIMQRPAYQQCEPGAHRVADKKAEPKEHHRLN